MKIHSNLHQYLFDVQSWFMGTRLGSLFNPYPPLLTFRQNTVKLYGLRPYDFLSICLLLLHSSFVNLVDSNLGTRSG